MRYEGPDCWGPLDSFSAEICSSKVRISTLPGPPSERRLGARLVISMRLLMAVSLLAVALLVGCGKVPATNGSDASTSRTASPPAPSPTPNAVLAAGDCTGQTGDPSSTILKSFGTQNMTLTIPSAWSVHTSEVTGASAMLYIEAPLSYGADNASFMLVAIPGPRRGSSAHEQAVDDATGHTALGMLSPVQDCTVGGEPASFYAYRDAGGNEVYRLFILHCSASMYPPLYAVVVSSRGPMDNRAITDVRAILGSWTWGTPTCDAYN